MLTSVGRSHGGGDPLAHRLTMRRDLRRLGDHDDVELTDAPPSSSRARTARMSISIESRPR
jgi:hypothetical protein